MTSITKDQINAYRAQVREQGDGLAMDVCDLALDGNSTARWLVAKWLREATPLHAPEVRS